MPTVFKGGYYDYKEAIFKVNPKHGGLDTRILRPLLEQLLAMLSHHNKIFVWRFDIRISTKTDNSKIITDFNRRFHKYIKRKYKITRVGFFWAREQERAKKQHYHYLLILDGNKIQSQHGLWDKVRELLCDLNASPYYSSSHLVRRSEINSNKFNDMTHHVSYLAKPRGKGYRPPQCKDYGGSRLKIEKNV